MRLVRLEDGSIVRDDTPQTFTPSGGGGLRGALLDRAASMIELAQTRDDQGYGYLALEMSDDAALMQKAAARVDALELALQTIVGHGNITVERAKQVAAEALATKN